MSMHDDHRKSADQFGATICERQTLQDGGKAMRFELVSKQGQRTPGDERVVVKGFAVAYDGNVYAYKNVCPHLGTELDWQPGEVFDESGLYLICATHGAAFEPRTGLCVGGPCKGAILSKIAIVVDNNLVKLSN